MADLPADHLITDIRLEERTVDNRKAQMATNSTSHEGESQDVLNFGPPPSTWTPPQEEGPDPFDPESLRLSQDFSASLGVKKALLTVPVRKPSREWFVRAHPDPRYRLQTAVIALKEPPELYLVGPALWSELGGESTFAPRMLITVINRQNVIFLWDIRLPGSDGRMDSWSRSAFEAAEMATSKWVRVQANMSLGAYDVVYAEHLPDPEWPDLPFRELLRIAFKDRFIQTLETIPFSDSCGARCSLCRPCSDPTARCGPLTSSSTPRPGNDPSRFALWGVKS